MKTVYAPNTTDAYVEVIREAMIANPVTSYALGVAALAVVCYVIRDWF